MQLKVDVEPNATSLIIKEFKTTREQFEGDRRMTIKAKNIIMKELAGMDTLCSGKTGTLTQNIMTIESKLPWCETLELLFLCPTH